MTVTTSPSSFALALARVVPRGVHLAPALVLAITVPRVPFVARTATRRPVVTVVLVAFVTVVVVVVMSPRARPSVARSRSTQ